MELISFADRKNPNCNRLKTLIKNNGAVALGVYAETEIYISWRFFRRGILSHPMSRNWIKDSYGNHRTNHGK